MTRAIQVFQVGVKAFLWHEQRLLLLQERDRQARWELPGGRIDVGEEGLPIEDVLRRELREELGTRFGCDIGAVGACWVRRAEAQRPLPVFLVGLLCTAPRGELVLSDEHQALRWVARDGWQQLDLAAGYREVLAKFFADTTPCL
jgi:8-oxo-dGTP pyrophosphatase MutT (NUDIX family)